MGANPAARNSWLRSRSGMSKACAMATRVCRLGLLRPRSMKLRCRWDISVSSDSSFWLFPRRSRQWRSSRASSTPAAWVSVLLITAHPLELRWTDGTHPAADLGGVVRIHIEEVRHGGAHHRKVFVVEGHPHLAMEHLDGSAIPILHHVVMG